METWKEIHGYEGMYEVSSLGNIRSVDRLGYDGRNLKSKKLKLTKNSNGYYRVSLCKNNICIKEYVHRIVAKNFICIEHEKKEVNHIDGNKKNNQINNLEWVTSYENSLHAFENGLNKIIFAKGSENKGSKLKEWQVIEIKKRYDQGESQGNIAKFFKVSQSRVSAICNKKAWKNIKH